MQRQFTMLSKALYVLYLLLAFRTYAKRSADHPSHRFSLYTSRFPSFRTRRLEACSQISSDWFHLRYFSCWDILVAHHRILNSSKTFIRCKATTSPKTGKPPPSFVFGYVPDSRTTFNFPFKGVLRLFATKRNLLISIRQRK